MNFLRKVVACVSLTCICALGSATAAHAQFTLEFGINDFTVTPQFNSLNTFSFSIGVDEPLVAGGVYNNPDLTVIDYDIFGTLTQATPSNFPAFNLMRTIVGDEFYTQGSSMSFTVSGSADLSDGLQISELEADASGRIFQFNGREVDTGRYHPALLELFANGTGRLENSNNMGGVNPSNNLVVDVTFGEEYIVDLGFASSLTLAPAPPIATGDFDADGVVDCDDANAYVGNLGQPAVGALAELDLDTDGMVTIADAEMLIGDLIVADNGVTGTIIGDVNCDGVVDVLGDAFALVESLGTSGTVYTDGDLDFSGNVDVLGDAFILVGNLGMSNN